MSESVNEALGKAEHYAKNGESDLAAQKYRSVLKKYPDNKAALAGLNALQQSTVVGSTSGAVIPQQQINKLGAFYKQGKLEEVLALAESLVIQFPNELIIHIMLGAAYAGMQRLDQAVESFNTALKINPENAVVHYNLGIALQTLGKPVEAIASFSKAVEIEPGLAQAQNNLGVVLHEFGRHKEALARYRMALQISPDNGDAFCNAGNALTALGRLDEAVPTYERALQINPEHIIAYNNFGNLLLKIGRIRDANTCFGKALQIKPDHHVAHSNILCSQQYDPELDVAVLKKERVKWWEAHGKNLSRVENSFERDITPGRCLRIGMVSPSFGSHPVGFLVIKLLENAGHLDMQFYCYSDRLKSDEYTHRLKQAANHWRDTHGISDEQLIDRIQQDRIDILFDLTGHYQNNRLTMFARKPAPIQIAWIEPGSRGLPTIDYILADEFHIPKAHESQYSEKVIRMPHGNVCFDPPGWPLPVSPLPASSNGFITFGCFNNPTKINGIVIEKWAEILNTLPSSKLVLKYNGMDAVYNKKRILSIFTEQGVDASRITFEGKSPRKEYLERYNDIDIALDTWPFSGGLITCETLWMGVPVVTTPGRSFAGRQSFSHMMNIGFKESIAESLDNYVETAVSLANDIETLANIRSGLREKMAASPLCDGSRFAADFAVLMRELWTTFADSVKHTPAVD